MKKFKWVNGKCIEYTPEEYELWNRRVQARLALIPKGGLGHWMQLWRGVSRCIREDTQPAGAEWWKLQIPVIKRLYREDIESRI